MKKALAKSLILSAVLLSAVTALAYAGDLSDADLYPDGAPVIYVEDESELPKAMRDNIEACKNDPDVAEKEAEKEREFNTFIESERSKKPVE